MGDDVSQIENIDVSKQSDMADSVDIQKEFRIQYRLLRKKLSLYWREIFKKNFVEILYITAQKPPIDFIISMQKQYPDKVIKVLMPLYEDIKNSDKISLKFDYFLQNKNNTAVVYKIPTGYENVQVYGVYTDIFSNIDKESDIYDIKYLSHFTKIARKAALKLKPDIIHADNVPLLLGLELGSRWLSGYPIKYIQTVHNSEMYRGIEPFWAAINLANKDEMKKINNDNIIKNSLKAIFNVNLSKKARKTKVYINYIYGKYNEYRQNVDISENTRENVLLARMNERILKMFPRMSASEEHMFNPIYMSMKQSSIKAVNFYSLNSPAWIKTLSDVISFPVKSKKTFAGKVHHPFNVDNFREVRILNKKYLVRELSEKRIELKFYDINLFEEENVNIRGYLDSFFKAPLFFVSINRFTTLDDIKTISLAILKAFELRKNIQVVYNYPKDLNNAYLKSLFDFFESQQALAGKWIALEGKINIPQFLSASDMILIPSGNCLGIEQVLYEALKYGCIPVISNTGFSRVNYISDIFEDMTSGCVFKNSIVTDENLDEYEALFIKTLEFYTNNSSSWNIIIKNAMNYDSGWDFKSLEEYNNAYEELI